MEAKLGNLQPNANSNFARQTPRLIAIVGGSGAGKSWLAARLQEILGKESALLSSDDFYRDRSHLSAAQRARVNFDHPRAIDWPLLESVLAECIGGNPVRLPRYDFTQHRRLSPGRFWRPRPLVFVEGLWLLRRPALRRCFSLSVFVDCAEHLRLKRRLQRDIRERGRTKDSIRFQFRKTVAPMHARFIASQPRWADIRLTGRISARKVKKLAERVRALVVK